MPNTTKDLVVARSKFLRQLGPDLIDAFFDATEILRLPTTSKILRQGAPSPGLYLVVTGSVEVTCENDAGQCAILHLCGPGDIFGEIEAITADPCSATCTAAPGTILRFCPAERMDALLPTRGFARALLHIAYDRMSRESTTKFVDQFYPVEQRLCAYLHRLSSEQPVIAKTQADLAGLMGCARQTLNRELGRLRDREVIALEKGRVRVLDRAALAAALPGHLATA
jgi:CRP-like cAMP-binding protein